MLKNTLHRLIYSKRFIIYDVNKLWIAVSIQLQWHKKLMISNSFSNIRKLFLPFLNGKGKFRNEPARLVSFTTCALKENSF